jgi:hypothetical protein
LVLIVGSHTLKFHLSKAESGGMLIETRRKKNQSIHVQTHQSPITNHQSPITGFKMCSISVHGQSPCADDSRQVFTISFVANLCISPDLDGNRGTTKMCPGRPTTALPVPEQRPCVCRATSVRSVTAFKMSITPITNHQSPITNHDMFHDMFVHKLRSSHHDASLK